MIRIGLAAALGLALTAAPVFAQTQERLVDVGITGGVNATGSDNPFTLLRQPAIERLLLTASERPVTAAEIEAAVAQTDLDASPDNFINVGAFRREGDQYVLDFNFFTAEDQRRLYAFTDEYAASLADAVLAHRDEFDAIFARYDMDGVDPRDLRYLILGCFILDWDGLTLTAERGYRRPAINHPNGGSYIMTARERADDVTLRGLYWGSHNTPHDGITLTSFGDHEASRPMVLPDLSWSIPRRIRDGSDDAELGRVLGRATGTQVGSLRSDLARLMSTFRDGPADSDTLAERSGLAANAVNGLLPLLEHIGYIEEASDDIYRSQVVVLDERDYAMMRDARALGWRIMDEWLADNYDAYRRDAAGLTPAEFDVPFEEQFDMLWHYIFGVTNRELAERGYFSKQYGEGRPWQGHTPLVWWSDIDEPASFGG